MDYPRYETIRNPETTIFEFESVGIKGVFRKIIVFSETNDAGVYNLSFGNKEFLEDGTLKVNDVVVSDNGDRNKVLATVAHAVEVFTNKYKTAYIFFRGATPARTRLYRMALSLNLDELSAQFTIFGAVLNKNRKVVNVPFEKEGEYFGFIIKRKDG